MKTQKQEAQRVEPQCINSRSCRFSDCRTTASVLPCVPYLCAELSSAGSHSTWVTQEQVHIYLTTTRFYVKTHFPSVPVWPTRDTKLFLNLRVRSSQFLTLKYQLLFWNLVKELKHPPNLTLHGSVTEQLFISINTQHSDFHWLNNVNWKSAF